MQLPWGVWGVGDFSSGSHELPPLWVTPYLVHNSQVLEERANLGFGLLSLL